MDDEPKHSCKGLSFIRVLNHDYSKQLQIPQEFTANFNGNVPRRFIIESTVTNKCWRVEVEKEVDGQIYFRRGWQAFVESHSLEAGSFLVFEYEEQSVFHVKVYGRNGCEKTTLKGDKGGQHKLEKTYEFKELGQSEADKCDEEILRKHQERKRMRELSPEESEHGIHKNQHAIINDSVRTAITSISKNNVSFSITFHELKKHQFTQLAVPRTVALLKLQNKKKVTLQNAKGDCWVVYIARYKNGRRFFSGGWKSFVDENGFVAGDTLDFEFISDTLVRVTATKTSQIDDQVLDHDSEVAEDQSTVNSMVGYDPGKTSEFEELGKSEALECDERTLRNHQEWKRMRELSPKEIEYGIHKNQHAVVSDRVRTAIASISKNSARFSITFHKWRKHQFTQLTIPKAVALLELSDKKKVMLQNAKGNCWPVNISHGRDGRRLFSGGWRSFVDDNGFVAGDTLDFEFISETLVRVIPTKTSQIDDQVVDTENTPEQPNSLHYSEVVEHQSKLNSLDGYDLGTTAEFEELGKGEVFECDETILRNHQERKRMREPSPEEDEHGIHKKPHAVVKDHSRTSEASVIEDTVCFSITLHESRKHQFIKLEIPMSVSLQMKLQDTEKITLQNVKGYCWEVKVLHKKNGKAILARGWNNFLSENGFGAGDILNFEFMSDDLIQVLATKTSQVNQPSAVEKNENKVNCTKDGFDIDKNQPLVGEKRTQAVKVSSISKDNVCFSITLHQQKNYQEIPKAITLQNHLGKKENLMLQDAEGNSWPVKVVHRRNGRGVFTQGWKKFVKEKGLVGGDTLNFEFVSDNVIQVHVRKATHVDPHSAEHAECQKQATDTLRDNNEPVASTTTDDKATEDSITTKTESFNVTTSTFSFTWNETTTRDYLNIPNEVAKPQEVMNKDKVVFQDAEGKCWPLQVRTWWDGRVVLTKGWVEFCKGHAISEGDSLHLEFMPNSVIKVTINKGNPKIPSDTTQELEAQNR